MTEKKGLVEFCKAEIDLALLWPYEHVVFSKKGSGVVGLTQILMCLGRMVLIFFTDG